MLNTIKKVGPVLDLFTAEQPEWRMTDIARALEMPKSSAHALVITLADVGLLSLTSSGRYRLGWNLLSLAERMRASLDLKGIATPAMRALEGDVRENVLLAVLDRREVVYVDKVEGTHPMVRLAGVRVGSRAPAHCTAVGKVLLAFGATELASDAALEPLTSRTIVDRRRLDAELATIRSDRFATATDELESGLTAVASPVFDEDGTAVAALAVSGPTLRLSPRRIAELRPTVIKQARALSEQLGHRKEGVHAA
jgi:DNA-binding IclR family transcriptional regulator